MMNLGSKPRIIHLPKSTNFKTYLIGKHVNISLKIAPRWDLLAPTRNNRLSVKRSLRYDLRTKTLNINTLPTFAFCAIDQLTYCFYLIFLNPSPERSRHFSLYPARTLVDIPR